MNREIFKFTPCFSTIKVINPKKHIIDKIIKIYNKSKNNPSEHEVKAAVLKVQEMLMKYNLSMLDIKIEEEPEDVKSIKYSKKSRWWHRKLGIIIAIEGFIIG